MNITTKRFPRTAREAFPFDEPFSVTGPYRRATAEGMLRDVLGLLVVIALVALSVHVLVDWAAAP